MESCPKCGRNCANGELRPVADMRGGKFVRYNQPMCGECVKKLLGTNDWVEIKPGTRQSSPQIKAFSHQEPNSKIRKKWWHFLTQR